MLSARLAVAVALAIGIGVIAACSDSTGSGSGGHTTNLSVRDNSFSPTPDTISAGQVTFTWAGSNAHNVTWVTGPGTLPVASSTQTSGTYQATLQQGTYTYHCTIHASQGMAGTIVVQ